MTRMMVSVEVYVEDTGRYRALTVDGGDVDVYTQVYLDREEALMAADRMEAIADRTDEGPLELGDEYSSLIVESHGWLKVRVTVNGISGTLDRFGVGEIARGLRAGWEGSE